MVSISSAFSFAFLLTTGFAASNSSYAQSRSLSVSNWVPVDSVGGNFSAASFSRGFQTATPTATTTISEANSSAIVTDKTYTTICSTPTTFVCSDSVSESTYYVSSSTTITFTDCPCTFHGVSTATSPANSSAGAATEGGVTESTRPSNATVATTVVSSFTTVCQGPTTLTTNNGTYTGASGQTLTITNCPCTLTHSGSAAASASTLASASASGSELVTTVVSSFTTVFHSQATLTTNGATYTATSGETVTVTNCPCTIKTPKQATRAVTGNATNSALTTVVSAFTTYCPSSTTLVTNGVTYTASAGETLTVTNCPCTVPKNAASPETESQKVLTTVVSAFTTICPSPTTLVTNSATYTASRGETLTITNCPCTLTTVSRVSQPESNPTQAAPNGEISVSASSSLQSGSVTGSVHPINEAASGGSGACVLAAAGFFGFLAFI